MRYFRIRLLQFFPFKRAVLTFSFGQESRGQRLLESIQKSIFSSQKNRTTISSFKNWMSSKQIFVVAYFLFSTFDICERVMLKILPYFRRFWLSQLIKYQSVTQTEGDWKCVRVFECKNLCKDRNYSFFRACLQKIRFPLQNRAKLGLGYSVMAIVIFCRENPSLKASMRKDSWNCWLWNALLVTRNACSRLSRRVCWFLTYTKRSWWRGWKWCMPEKSLQYLSLIL